MSCLLSGLFWTVMPVVSDECLGVTSSLGQWYWPARKPWRDDKPRGGWPRCRPLVRSAGWCEGATGLPPCLSPPGRPSCMLPLFSSVENSPSSSSFGILRASAALHSLEANAVAYVCSTHLRSAGENPVANWVWTLSWGIHPTNRLVPGLQDNSLKTGKQRSSR